MVKRLLSALEYPECDVNVNDEATFRKIVVWLEQNKINKANPNVANGLKNITSNDWPNHFQKYQEILGLPNLQSHQEQLQWLLGYAVQIETHNNRQVYIKHAVENLKATNVPTVVTENPLDKLDFHSKEFAEGISKVAQLLNITPHPDPLVTLKAVTKLVTVRLSPQAQANPSEVVLKGTPFPFQDADLGFDLNDPVLNQAAKVLRILYIHDLRHLQTRANELIVAVQNITANPKTDTKLGKVGK
ncbi:RNA transcription, translation and transport factor protein [Tribolium madens]|uniref:RNA transcription, translation and transport factor protein n=1 Tax=Tribolium madens TaxID=41895 RepID=UPI001CF73D2C|nr:RNA transcription, translation and transport factor protein [Tribolium madens]